MNFIIFNLNNGSQKPCDLANLSESLSPNCEIIRIIGNKHEAIGYVSHSLLVHFAVEFAHYAHQNYTKDQDPKVQNCIDLTRKWVQDQSSVSKEELESASNAAYAAYAASAASADAAAAASNAAAANDAAYTALNAADAAAYAADAAYAAGKNKLDEQNRQGNFILKFFEVE